MEVEALRKVEVKVKESFFNESLKVATLLETKYQMKQAPHASGDKGVPTAVTLSFIFIRLNTCTYILALEF